MVLGKIISSEGYTFGQKWIISMIFRSFFITCIHKYDPNSPCASKMISIFMIFYYLYGIFWYCEVRSVGSLTLIKSRFGRSVYIWDVQIVYNHLLLLCNSSYYVCVNGRLSFQTFFEKKLFDGFLTLLLSINSNKKGRCYTVNKIGSKSGNFHTFIY